MGRIAASADDRTLPEVIKDAQLYVAGRIWLSPVQLKSTIRRLVETVEARLEEGMYPEPAAQKASRKTPQGSEIQSLRPTHRGAVLGLKGRDDYEALLVQVEGGYWQDEQGRRFNARDYGYNPEETYRLDLETLQGLK
jgi:hypothetical protein